MTDLGYIALVLAFLLSLYGIVVSVVGARRSQPELVTSGRNAVYVVSGLVLLAAVLLWRALLTNEFQVDFVATATASAPCPPSSRSRRSGAARPARCSSGAAGLGDGRCGHLVLPQADQPSLKPWVNAVLLINIAFFLSLLLFAENPFERLWRAGGGQASTAVFQPAGATAAHPRGRPGPEPAAPELLDGASTRSRSTWASSA